MVVNDGDLEATHLSVQRIIESKVRQGVLADSSTSTTGSRPSTTFQPEGAELNPKPLLSEEYAEVSGAG